jgi:hypothetical protein
MSRTKHENKNKEAMMQAANRSTGWIKPYIWQTRLMWEMCNDGALISTALLCYIASQFCQLRPSLNLQKGLSDIKFVLGAGVTAQ